VAVVADGDRTEELTRIATPGHVIHGRMDQLIALSGGDAATSVDNLLYVSTILASLIR